MRGVCVQLKVLNALRNFNIDNNSNFPQLVTLKELRTFKALNTLLSLFSAIKTITTSYERCELILQEPYNIYLYIYIIICIHLYIYVYVLLLLQHPSRPLIQLRPVRTYMFNYKQTYTLPLMSPNTAPKCAPTNI